VGVQQRPENANTSACNEVPRITESSVESTRMRMEQVPVICEVGRLSIAL
jgi:hypothetical protein